MNSCRENLSSPNLMLGEYKAKTYGPINFPSPLPKTNSLSETTVSQTQPAFICSNSPILTVG